MSPPELVRVTWVGPNQPPLGRAVHLRVELAQRLWEVAMELVAAEGEDDE